MGEADTTGVHTTAAAPSRVLTSESVRPIGPPVPVSIIEAYPEENLFFAELPPGIDTAMVLKFLGSVQSGEATWEQLATMQLAGEQLEYAQEQMAIIHLIFGIPVIGEGVQVMPEKLEDVKQLAAQYYEKFGKPRQSATYAADEHGIPRVKPERIAQSFSSFRYYCLAVLTNYAKGVAGLPAGDIVMDKARLIDADDLEVLEAVFGNGPLRPMGDAGRRLMEKGLDAMSSRDAKSVRDAQKANFHLRKGGNPNIIVTPALRGIVGILEAGIRQEYEALSAGGVEVDPRVVDQLVNDLAHKREFGLT